MGRAPCCDKANVKKGPWSPEEDAKLKSYIEQHGTGGNWIALPQKIGLKRCGKSCRLRWLNYLRPNLKHGEFSEEEDNIICSMYIAIGSRWSIIAGQLPGRTDNDIKNYWNTRLKKKLLGSKQRKDPNQTTTRRARILKQEARGEEINIGSTGQPNTYSWPEPGGPSSIYSIHHDESSSMRRLLMKLGGRLSTEPSFVVPPPPPPPPPPPLQVYGHDANSANMMLDLDQNSVISSDGLPGSSWFNNIPTKLDDMFGGSCNSAKLEGLDCFYGVGHNNINIVDDQTSGTALCTTNFKSNWSEVSPSINYQSISMMPSYQQMQACLFEDTL